MNRVAGGRGAEGRVEKRGERKRRGGERRGRGERRVIEKDVEGRR